VPLGNDLVCSKGAGGLRVGDPLELDLDRMVVESFEAEPVRANREGTVRGHQQTGVETCYPCYPCTDWISCPATCDFPSCACQELRHRILAEPQSRRRAAVSLRLRVSV
jgi:hypothetical protein